jgi:poly-gamma-glutamate biosynthesis protein PgsC/CapC
MALIGRFRQTVHEYLFEADLVRIAVLAGIVVSTLLYERLHLTTGGAIVPGYLALFVLQPLAIGVTLIAAYLTFRIVNGPLASRMIVYGRRKFEIEVLIGLGFVVALVILAQLPLGVPLLATSTLGVGFVIPGLVAHDMFRQGPAKTLGVLAVAVAAVAAIIVVLTIVTGTAGQPIVDAPAAAVSAARAFDTGLLLPAVVISVLAALVIFRVIGLRSGGFVPAAYLALVSPELRDLAFAVVVAVVTYVVVVKLLAPHILLFGRRKVAMMVLVGATIAWAAELAVIAATAGAFQPWSGLNAITLIVPGLLANDAERQGPERTVWGVTLATLVVLAGTSLLQVVIDALPRLAGVLQGPLP